MTAALPKIAERKPSVKNAVNAPKIIIKANLTANGTRRMNWLVMMELATFQWVLTSKVLRSSGVEPLVCHVVPLDSRANNNEFVMERVTPGHLSAPVNRLLFLP